MKYKRKKYKSDIDKKKIVIISLISLLTIGVLTLITLSAINLFSSDKKEYEEIEKRNIKIVEKIKQGEADDIVVEENGVKYKATGYIKIVGPKRTIEMPFLKPDKYPENSNDPGIMRLLNKGYLVEADTSNGYASERLVLWGHYGYKEGSYLYGILDFKNGDKIYSYNLENKTSREYTVSINKRTTHLDQEIYSNPNGNNIISILTCPSSGARVNPDGSRVYQFLKGIEK